ncbi:hypothetical protein G8770_03880 [Aestuariicella hydrocarbonica]|uniref:ATP-grasp domain-containing protein n=1 Tax=Pseudomaricurvus hydrocarbonicus TaxID=1470433 RepID=A0A9E5JQB4_9GAMM|nr:hypothetical protein [Aestuariicella hydrocarbonica]NHO64683.1 hypothetical protein [Aestuariicella hydrocarbonica]
MRPHCIIIYGVDTQIGLSLVRELGKRGCRVIAIGKKEAAVGLYSRYVSERYTLTPSLSIDEKAHRLNEIASETGARHLLCISEDDILLFNQMQPKLKHLIPLVPDLDTMNKVLDKSYTMAVAKTVGIETPKSIQIHAERELEPLLSELTFPVILKWSNPHSVLKRGAELGIKIEKLLYLYSAEELRNVIRTYAPLNSYPMIQEYVAGYGLGQFFFMHEGKDLLRFQHRRLHEWPPEGGYSSLCEALPLENHQALQEKSIELLKALNWSGVAMVEYRYDPATERAVLMEINGRFWGSYPLAYHSNVPFAWFTYQVLGCGQLPAPEPITHGIRCRNLLVEFKRLYRIWCQPNLIQDKSRQFEKWQELATVLSDFFNPKTRYYLFSWDDYKPALADLKAVSQKTFKSLWK